MVGGEIKSLGLSSDLHAQAKLINVIKCSLKVSGKGDRKEGLLWALSLREHWYRCHGSRSGGHTTSQSGNSLGNSCA